MNWIAELKNLPPKGIYSQFNEDLILQEIFKNVGLENKIFVDIGAGLGISNTRFLREQMWTGLALDANPNDVHGITGAWVTPDNIVDLMIGAGIPDEFDFLNLDIDSCDYWVLQNVLAQFRPRVICTEFNGCLDPSVPVALIYEDGYFWDQTDKYGYSFAAGIKLMAREGYTVIFNQHETNLFAVADEYLGDVYVPQVKAIRQQYHPHNPGQHWTEV